MAEKPNILIAVPAYGGQVAIGAFRSVIRMVREFDSRGIGWEQRDLDMSDIVFVRNCFGSTALQETQFTHLLQIDSDMSFEPSAIFKMLDANLPIIGCIAAKRSTKGGINVRTSTKPTFNNQGIAAVDGVGTGIMLIQRDALETMSTMPDLKVTSTPNIKQRGLNAIYGFFDRIELDDGSLLGEDLSFCQRASKAGLQPYALHDESVGHSSRVSFKTPADLFTAKP